MKASRFLFVTAFIALCVFQGKAQADTIFLANPSFEMRIARHSITPDGWVNIGPEGESEPDVQPGSFGCQTPAQHGDTYLGMVARDNNTWEGVGQRLSSNLLKDSTYTFSLFLAQSPEYTSLSRVSGEKALYVSPLILVVWGVNAKHGAEEMLAQTEAVAHKNWLEYRFELQPGKDDFDEINLVAYYAPGLEKRNGNLLVDNCSPIIRKKK
jgi:hypothetical protein